jgi:hypothetical protein
MIEARFSSSLQLPDCPVDEKSGDFTYGLCAGIEGLDVGNQVERVAIPF